MSSFLPEGNTLQGLSTVGQRWSGKGIVPFSHSLIISNIQGDKDPLPVRVSQRSTTQAGNPGSTQRHRAMEQCEWFYLPWKRWRTPLESARGSRNCPLISAFDPGQPRARQYADAARGSF